MNRILIAFAALALSLTSLGLDEAQACGPYGPPTAETTARWAVWSALHRHRVDGLVRHVRVDLADERSPRRGRATIAYRSGYELTVGLIRYRGRWAVMGRQPPRIRAVAAR